MAPFQRSQVNTLVNRLAEPPSQLIAVFGPRQTGKSTIVRQALQQIPQGSTYLSVDEPDAPLNIGFPEPLTEQVIPLPQIRNADWLIRNWEAARRHAELSGNGSVLVFDEIQKIPRWSETVKGLWDADRANECPLHVVILGSSPLLMQSGLNESLAGRFESLQVTHWSFQEMSSAFGMDLSEYLYFGGYPGAVRFIGEPDRWREFVLRALVEPNIERDIVAMTRIEKPALLKKLFELGAAYSGQIFSYNKMLGQLQDAGNSTTLSRYLDLLSHAGLLTGLSKYSNREHLRKGSSPKLNVLNTALMTSVSGYSFDEAKADRTFWGRIAESAVGAHLCNTATPNIGVYYWRESPYEVDFVIQRGPKLVAIEVKSGSGRVNARGKAEFETRFRPGRWLLVGAEGIPLNEFLLAPAGEWFEQS